MRELVAVFGLLLIVVAIDLQPWHRRFRNPLMAAGTCLIIIGLAIILPESWRALLAGTTFIIPLGIIIAGIIAYLIWRIVRYVEHRLS